MIVTAAAVVAISTIYRLVTSTRSSSQEECALCHGPVANTLSTIGATATTPVYDIVPELSDERRRHLRGDAPEKELEPYVP